MLYTSSPWQTCSFTLHPLGDLFLYTSSPGRPVPLHFTSWETCSFTLHSLGDMFLYTSPPRRPVPLHFTPWETCSFTLHPLGDLFLYTSPLGYLFLYTSPLADMFLYTSLPGRPVHSIAISTSLGSIQPCCTHCAKTIHSYIHLSLARYSFIQLSELRIQSLILSIKSPMF